MKRHSRGAKKRSRTLQLWTHAQAQAALPYLASVLRSVREHALESQAHRLALNRLANRPGRPDRQTLLAQMESDRLVREADERFGEALDELQVLDVYCTDPIRGEAVIPFLHRDQLAWYLYDLFDDRPLRFWRYDSDPADVRRPLAEVLPDSDAALTA